jgi:serine/threonine-protein kinase
MSAPAKPKTRTQLRHELRALADRIGDDAVRECVLVQRRAAARGRKLSLREIAVARGYLTPSGGQPAVVPARSDPAPVLELEDLEAVLTHWLLQSKHRLRGAVHAVDEGCAAPPFRRGHMIGEFRILKLLGTGPLATVYRAVGLRRAQQCTFKVYTPESFAGDVAVKRFRSRANRTVQLKSPYLPASFGAGRIPSRDLVLFAAESVEGLSLRRVLERAGRLPEPVALAVAVQLAEALAACHARGIVHGNLKPENVLISRTGRALVLDAGLERSTEAAVRALRRGEPCSPALGRGLPYLAPEYARGDGEFAVQDDVYSLGALLYHMISGTPPFSGEPAGLVEAVTSQHFPTFDAPGLQVSTDIRFLVGKMTRAERLERYRDMAIVSLELQRILSQIREVQNITSGVRRVFEGLDDAIESLDTPAPPPHPDAEAGPDDDTGDEAAGQSPAA